MICPNDHSVDVRSALTALADTLIWSSKNVIRDNENAAN